MTEPEGLAEATARALSAELELLVAGTDAVLAHAFEHGPGTYGWQTRICPAGQGSEVWLWVDGLDDDLMLIVDDRWYFEWRHLADEPAAVGEAVAICAAVLAGRLRPHRSGLRWKLEATSADGQRFCSWPERRGFLSRIRRSGSTGDGA